MNKRNDIELIKKSIKELVYRKNITVFNVILSSDVEKMKNAIDSGLFRYFSISRDEFRSVDHKCVVNGKKTWLKKIAIQEMIDEGELIDIKSYSTLSYDSYAKMYPLTYNRFIEIKDKYMPFDIKKKPANAEANKSWTPDDPFLDDCDWPNKDIDTCTITEMFEYDISAKAKFENDCRMLAERHKFIEKNKFSYV